MEKVQANRNFANKLWNTARYIVMGIEKLSETERQALAVSGPMDAAELASMPLPERWVISRCHSLVERVTRQLSAYDFGPAGQSIYAFLWDEYADWYLEISKRRIASDDAHAAMQARRTLVYVLDSCLRLLHPFMPFITEELWQRLPHDGPSLMISHWPQLDEERLALDERAIEQFSSLQSLARAVRNARAEYRVEPAKKIAATVLVEGELADALAAEADAIAFVARVDPGLLDFRAPSSAQGGEGDDDGSAVRLVVDENVQALLPLAELIDAEKERQRLGKQQATLEASIAKVQARLDSPGFADKAPAAVVAKATNELSEQREQLNEILKALERLPA